MMSIHKMKPILLFLVLFSHLTCATPVEVFICDGPNARKYHYKENCRGLSNCQYRVKKTTLENAKKEAKTLCRWEQKK
jgi:hypothetical protein